MTIDAQPRVLRAGAATSVAGHTFTPFGGSGPADEPVALLVRRAGEADCSLLTVVRTSSDSTYAVTQAPLVNRSYRALLPRSPYSPIAQVDVAVRTALRRTSPANGAVISRRTPVIVRGTARPAQPGATVVLQSRTGTSTRQVIARGTVAADGSFTITRSALAPGRYTLQLAIGATPTNAPGASTEFIVTVR
ncbi:MAG: hypothetical protein LC640_13395 [Frankia sp.]|nr:hypothetical protein [Frankia sp.]